MKLVEPAIYRYLIDQGITDPIYIGVADAESVFPLVLIQRIDTETIHTKDQDSQSEEIRIQITSASNGSMLLANTLDESISTILRNLQSTTITIEAGNDLLIRHIYKDNNTYMYDVENSVHNIHTDYIVTI